MSEPRASKYTIEQLEDFRRLARIFTPHATAKQNELYPKGAGSYARFVHYTSAENAVSIIKSRCIWMRNTSCMADYREVNHGIDMLVDAFQISDTAKRFFEATDNCQHGVAHEAASFFNHHRIGISTNTYITSLSEHLDHEDRHGRLSMWRAFAPNTARVALVIRIPFLSGVAERLRILFSPVGYLNPKQIIQELQAVTQNVESECAYLKTVDRNLLRGSLIAMLLAAATSLKHEGFSEEREWRAIYCPNVLPTSDLMKSTIEVIHGVPQRVYKLPLGFIPDESLADLEIARIFDRLIIGPTQYQNAIRDTFLDALREAGVKDPEHHVVASGIPLRT